MREQHGTSSKDVHGKNHSTVRGCQKVENPKGSKMDNSKCERRRVPTAGAASRLSHQLLDFDAILQKANRGFSRKQSDRYVEWDDAIIAMKAAVRQAIKEKTK